MDTKRVVPAVTAVFLGGVWLWMSSKHITPPQALNQALIGAIGAVFAAGAIPKNGVTR